MTKLQICMVASEVAPFAKTGGLADVVAGLSRYLRRTGHDVRLVMPMYPRVRAGGWPLESPAVVQDMVFALGPRRWTVSASCTKLPGSRVEVWLVRCPELFGRDELYSAGADEPVRFAVLSCAAVEICQRLAWAPHVFHCNDWHTALLPLYLKTRYAWDRLLAGSRSLLAIHNLGFQGVSPVASLEPLGLSGEQHLLHEPDLRAGHVNLLRTGVRYADGLVTVSRTYAAEIQTPELGMGLHEDLAARRDALRGIVNGCDYDVWNPATDPALWARYSPSNLAGKAVNKRELLASLGLGDGVDLPLAGIVSRLTYQKGFELLAEALPVLLQRGELRLAVLGTGEPKYERFFHWLRDTYPRHVAYHAGYDDQLAHRIEAGADLFLMPSRYEPCGLNQMYSLKYGTVPVVRRTGGLADTVEPYDEAADRGTGFCFDAPAAQALLDTVRYALRVFEDRAAWQRLMRRGMQADWSWDAQGPHYVDVYRALAHSG